MSTDDRLYAKALWLQTTFAWDTMRAQMSFLLQKRAVAVAEIALGLRQC